MRFWKRLGEEYADPLIVTGTVVCRAYPRGGSIEPDRCRVPALSTYFQLTDRADRPDVAVAVGVQCVLSDRAVSGMAHAVVICPAVSEGNCRI